MQMCVFRILWPSNSRKITSNLRDHLTDDKSTGISEKTLVRKIWLQIDTNEKPSFDPSSHNSNEKKKWLQAQKILRWLIINVPRVKKLQITSFFTVDRRHSQLGRKIRFLYRDWKFDDKVFEKEKKIGEWMDSRNSGAETERVYLVFKRNPYNLRVHAQELQESREPDDNGEIALKFRRLVFV